MRPAAAISFPVLVRCAGMGSTAAQRQFDFLLGYRDVKYAEGRLPGRNHIERILGGCVLQENWMASSGEAEGYSFNHCNAWAGFWHQA